ncbi:MAG: leucine-rich repeat domain-containing protein [Promethearchaeota archaeon]
MFDKLPKSERDIMDNFRSKGFWFRIQNGHLEQLGLKNFGLSSLPENIGDLKFLIRLDLNGNKLKSLPESIGNLKLLTNLDISNNKLTSLPESFRNLKISVLSIGGNQFKSLTGFSDEFLRRLPDNLSMDLDLTPKGAKLLSDHQYKDLAIYYKKSASKLALQYLSDPKSLTEDEIKRVNHEIGPDGLKSLKKFKEMKLTHYKNLPIEPPISSKFLVKIITNLDNATFLVEVSDPNMKFSQIFSETNINNNIPNPNQYCNSHDLGTLVRCSQIFNKRNTFFSSQIYNKRKLVRKVDLFKDFPGTHHIDDGQNVYTLELDLVASRGLIKEIYDC